MSFHTVLLDDVDPFFPGVLNFRTKAYQLDTATEEDKFVKENPSLSDWIHDRLSV